MIESYPTFWQTGISVTIFFGLLPAASYLGLEPIIRRRQPEWLTSWARLLEGRWLDSRVGRDLLIGLAGGLLLVLTSALIKGGPARAGENQAAAVGGWLAFSLLLRTSSAVTIAFVLLLILVIAQMVLRRKWLGWLNWIPGAAAVLMSPFTDFAIMLLTQPVLVARFTCTPGTSTTESTARRGAMGNSWKAGQDRSPIVDRMPDVCPDEVAAVAFIEAPRWDGCP